MSDKPEALKVEKSEVKPVTLPESKGQVGPPGHLEEDTRPRHERRRSKRQDDKKKKEVLGAIKKQQQALRKPLRHADMNLIVSQVFGQLRPLIQGMQDHFDKLDYLPDYLADVMDGERKPSISDFDEWFKELVAELEAAEKEEDVECSCESGCEKCTPDPTEETQEEQVLVEN